MAELGALTTPPLHKLASDQNPYKPITSLLSKAAFFLLLLVVLPLFPSQAPEFVNQTLLTRSWELLHVLLVGVAVSYGLFSQRNAEPASEKEALRRADSTSLQSYLTQLLQVSPVSDDEGPGTPSGPEENRLQMWTSRYHREEPTVVVAAESPGDGGGVGRRLLLPVRSLRSPVPHADTPRRDEGHEKPSAAGAGARSFPRGRAKGWRVAEMGRSAQEEDLSGDRVVELPSTIPWPSRSARMEPKEEMADAVTFRSLSFCSPPSPKEEMADAVTFRSVSFRSPPSGPSSVTPSTRRLSPSPSLSLSPEPRAKAGDDPWRKKALFKVPPPPPPLPPPHPVHRTPSPPPAQKIACRSFRLETSNGGSRPGREDDRGWSSDVGSPRSPSLHYYSLGRSMRTLRPREVLRDAMADVATRVTPTREKEKRKKKKKEEEELEDEAAMDSRDSDEAGVCPSDAGELPDAAAAGGGVEEEEEVEENEVDKKADEFIAKFREQIRLQRIDSIKRTAVPGGRRKP